MGRRRKNGDGAAKIGHNSNLRADQKVKLSGFVAEIARIEAEVRDLNAQKSIIYKSALEADFDTKALRHVVWLRRLEKSKRSDFEAAIEAYATALGDFVATPLGQAMAPRPQDDLDVRK